MKSILTWSALTLAVSSAIPTRELAGVSVIDTPLVRAAEAFALEHSSWPVYKHIMRSWLYGVLLINLDEELSRSIDLEVHALAAILHDLGWDQTPNSTFISPDRRFEVDGAIAARDFISSHEDGSDWEKTRVQLVWDSIALHAVPSIADYKELDVQVVSKGIRMDFTGPSFGVSEEDYALIGRQYPKDDLISAANQTLIWLCQSKPASTYGKAIPVVVLRSGVNLLLTSQSSDTWQQPWGETYVDGYSAQGKRAFDLMHGVASPP
jgi:hypothetical protein